MKIGLHTFGSSAPLKDGVYSLVARSTWIETKEELDKLIPPYKTWQRRLGRFSRLVL